MILQILKFATNKETLHEGRFKLILKKKFFFLLSLPITNMSKAVVEFSWEVFNFPVIENNKANYKWKSVRHVLYTMLSWILLINIKFTNLWYHFSTIKICTYIFMYMYVPIYVYILTWQANPQGNQDSNCHRNEYIFKGLQKM